MSSNNNSEANGMIFAIALVVTGLMVLGIVIYVVVALFTLALSIFCLFALHKPRKIGKNIVTPQIARWFLIRGTIGWFAFPLIVTLVAQAMDSRIDADWIIHIMIAGYIIGALGGELVLEALEEQADETASDIVAPPAPLMLPLPEPKPFAFASWEDEWRDGGAANDDGEPRQ